MWAQAKFDEVGLAVLAAQVIPPIAEPGAGAITARALSLSFRDDSTRRHCERLSSRAVALGQALQLPADDIHALRLGGMVHDVGKLFIPEDILNKPSQLSAHERSIVKEHPALGERFCAPVKALAPALPAVRHHHERFDGSGYPDHLCGEQIPLIARIVQIVDIFDALTTERPYKAAWTAEQSLGTMATEAERGWLDERLLREFAALVTKR
ncbi:MAG TPA: HD domain-containing phosphohydrolase [Terriglobales bacterium]|nr:HD domain-containing phosphohydrolase [Terriglobales bacterium]